MNTGSSLLRKAWRPKLQEDGTIAPQPMTPELRRTLDYLREPSTRQRITVEAHTLGCERMADGKAECSCRASTDREQNK